MDVGNGRVDVPVNLTGWNSNNIRYSNNIGRFKRYGLYVEEI
jgi:hypothetical protein